MQEKHAHQVIETGDRGIIRALDLLRGGVPYSRDGGRDVYLCCFGIIWVQPEHHMGMKRTAALQGSNATCTQRLLLVLQN